jgi:hypothetical protein
MEPVFNDSIFENQEELTTEQVTKHLLGKE